MFYPNVSLEKGVTKKTFRVLHSNLKLKRYVDALIMDKERHKATKPIVVVSVKAYFNVQDLPHQKATILSF